MKIQVLGPGCSRCAKLLENVETAVRELGLECRIEKVTDMQQMLAHGVMSTPALVVDGQVKLSGRVPSPADIKSLLQ